MQQSLTLLSPLDAATLSRLTSVLRRRLPETEIQVVPLGRQSLLPETDGVVLPLLLTADVHVDGFPHGHRLGALGPHPLLAAAMAQQLEAAGARRGDAVIMVAEEASTTAGLVDTLNAGRMLQSIWGAPVGVAHLRGRGRRVHELVPEMRRQGNGRVVAASYVLGDGAEQRRVIAHACTAGATTVSAALGTHPLVAELIVRRYRAALQAVAIGKVA